MSVSIALDDADLLDIDGSDDATVMFAKKLGRGGANKGSKKAAAPQQVVNVRAETPEDLRRTNPIERDAEVYEDAQPTLLFDDQPSVIIAGSTTIASVEKTVRKPQAPAHFWRPRERKVEDSYPPVAVMNAAAASAALGGGRSQRWVWAAAAVIGTALLIVGSLRGVPHPADASSNAAQPPPAAVEEAPKPADDANVVKFDQDDAVTVKRAPKPAAPARHWWTPPWKRPAAPSAPAAKKTDAPKPAAPEAPHKKTAEEKELEELQLKAMQR